MAPKVSEGYKEEKRQLLRNKAMTCFGRKGFESATIDEIASEADVSKGMLYTYFRSKEEIFLSILHDMTVSQMEELKQEMQRYSTALDKLLVVINRYGSVPFSEQQRQWVRVYTEFWLRASTSDRRQYLLQRYDILMNLLTEVIELGQSSGEFREDVKPDTAASLYWALCDGIHLQNLQVGSDENHRTLWKGAKDMVLRYIAHG